MSAPSDDALRRALEAANVPLATFDSEGHALTSNAAFARLFGTTPDSVIGRHLVGLCRPEHAPEVTSALVRIIGRVSESEHLDIRPTRRREGENIRLNLSITPPRNGRAAVIFCVAGPREPGGSAGASPAGQSAASTTEHSLTDRIAAAVDESQRTQRPFALLQCSLEMGPAPSATSAPGDFEPIDPETEQIAITRINQRLRLSDSVVRGTRGVVYVVAEQLGDSQDAVGVAYRLLSTAVEPVATSSQRVSVRMTVGIALGDGSSDAASVIASASRALETAHRDEQGGFCMLDLRATPDPRAFD